MAKYKATMPVHANFYLIYRMSVLAANFLICQSTKKFSVYEELTTSPQFARQQDVKHPLHLHMAVKHHLQRCRFSKSNCFIVPLVQMK